MRCDKPAATEAAGRTARLVLVLLFDTLLHDDVHRGGCNGVERSCTQRAKLLVQQDAPVRLRQDVKELYSMRNVLGFHPAGVGGGGVLNSINNDAISQPWFTISQLPTVTGTSRNYPHHVPASAYYPRRSLIIPMTYSMAYGRAMCTLTPVCTMNVGWCCCRNKGQRKESTCRSSCLLILPPKMKRRGGGAHSASSSRASRIGRR
jgi:hypothetical protein